jgi:ribosomal protein S18 acetylase RimI-like enzyme
MTIATTIAPARPKLFQEILAGVDFAVASPADADELAVLYRRFFDEADYKSRGIVYAPEKVLDSLQAATMLGRYPHIIARTRGYDGKIIGFVSYSLDDAFCVDPVAVMDNIYVAPEYRRSAIGRVLIALVLEMAIGDGACAFHAPVASGTTAAKSLLNSFKRAGFSEIGMIVGRGL